MLRKELLGKRLIAATRLARWELELANAVKHALARQRKHALSVIHHTYGARAVTASIPPNVFDDNAWADDMGDDGEITTAAQGIFDEIRKTTAGRFLTKPGELPSIDIRHRLDRVLDEMQGLGQATSDAIGHTLTQGVFAGESIDKLAARVQSVFDSSDARATLIARTEVVGASNGLAHDYASAVAGTGTLPLQKTWLATVDDRTRPAHVDADGQTVQSVEEPFDVDGEELMYPGDENGSPENVCNCRCTVIYDDAGTGEYGDELHIDV